MCVWTCIQTIDYTCFCIHPSARKCTICVYTRAYICMSLPVLIYLICACVWMHVQPVDYIFMCKHSNPPSNNILYVCYLNFFFCGSRNRTTCSDSSCKSYNAFQRRENFFSVQRRLPICRSRSYTCYVHRRLPFPLHAVDYYYECYVSVLRTYLIMRSTPTPH